MDSAKDSLHNITKEASTSASNDSVNSARDEFFTSDYYICVVPDSQDNVLGIAIANEHKRLCIVKSFPITLPKKEDWNSVAEACSKRSEQTSTAGHKFHYTFECHFFKSSKVVRRKKSSTKFPPRCTSIAGLIKDHIPHEAITKAVLDVPFQDAPPLPEALPVNSAHIVALFLLNQAIGATFKCGTLDSAESGTAIALFPSWILKLNRSISSSDNKSFELF